MIRAAPKRRPRSAAAAARRLRSCKQVLFTRGGAAVPSVCLSLGGATFQRTVYYGEHTTCVSFGSLGVAPLASNQNGDVAHRFERMHSTIRCRTKRRAATQHSTPWSQISKIVSSDASASHIFVLGLNSKHWVPRSHTLTQTGARLPRLCRDCAHRCHICTGTWARCCHICAGTCVTAATSVPGLGPTPATSVPGLSRESHTGDASLRRTSAARATWRRRA